MTAARTVAGEICDEYAGKDKRVSFPSGKCRVELRRNKGLEHASGTYIAFVDSDDYVTSTYLQSFTHHCLPISLKEER